MSFNPSPPAAELIHDLNLAGVDPRMIEDVYAERVIQTVKDGYHGDLIQQYKAHVFIYFPPRRKDLPKDPDLATKMNIRHITFCDLPESAYEHNYWAAWHQARAEKTHPDKEGASEQPF